MFPAKKKRSYGDCPSCRGERLIYHSRDLNHAYFTCGNCGYTLKVFDPFILKDSGAANNSKMVVEVYNNTNRAASQHKAEQQLAAKKLLEEYFERFKQMLLEVSNTQTAINAKLDNVLDVMTELHRAGAISDEEFEQNKEVAVALLETENEEYLSTAKAAELLGYTSKNAYQKVLKLIHKGEITAKKPGRSYIVAKTELERFLMENNI